MFLLLFPREYIATKLYSDYNSRADLNTINTFFRLLKLCPLRENIFKIFAFLEQKTFSNKETSSISDPKIQLLICV